MRTFITLLLPSLLLCGCCCFGPDKQSLAVWHSPDATLVQRMNAAQDLVSTGTKEATAKRILGQPSRNYQYDGPVFYAPDSCHYKGVNDVVWCDVRKNIYDFTNGNYVALDFDMGPPNDHRKTPRLLDIWIGNTNVNTFVLTPSGKSGEQ